MPSISVGFAVKNGRGAPARRGFAKRVGRLVVPRHEHGRRLDPRQRIDRLVEPLVHRGEVAGADHDVSVRRSARRARRRARGRDGDLRKRGCARPRSYGTNGLRPELWRVTEPRQVRSTRSRSASARRPRRRRTARRMIRGERVRGVTGRAARAAATVAAKRDGVGGRPAEAVELPDARRKRAPHHEVVGLHRRPARRGGGDLEHHRPADDLRLLGQVRVRPVDLRVDVLAKLAPRRRRDRGRHAEELAEPHVVGPELIALGFGELPHEQLVEVDRRVGRGGDRPQHQLGIVGRVRRPGLEAPGVLRQRALDVRVHAVDGGKDPVGLLARAEEDRLEHLRRRDQAVERAVGGAVVEERAHEVPRVERADPEGALAVEKAHRALALDAAEHGAGREVAVVGAHLTEASVTTIHV